MSDTMLKIPNVSVVVVRDGKPVTPALGKPFSFTAEEVEEINAACDETALLDVNVAEAEAIIAAARAAAADAGGKPAPRGKSKKADDDTDDL